jgi:hippurate hydrolase
VVTITGTVRTFDPAVQDRIEQAIRQVTAGVAMAGELAATVDYQRLYPATINDAEATQEALDAAATVGEARLAPDPAFTSEDFAFMLQACKGVYLAGSGTAGRGDAVAQPAL